MPVKGPPPGWLDAAPGTPERDTPKKHIAHDSTMHKWIKVLLVDNRFNFRRPRDATKVKAARDKFKVANPRFATEYSAKYRTQDPVAAAARVRCRVFTRCL